MIVTISEDLGRAPIDPLRFLAALVDDPNPRRAGFGATEDAAFAELAAAFRRKPAAFRELVTIERFGVR